MKKNILLLLMSLLFMSANAQECDDGCETNLYAKVLVGANFLQNTKIHNTDFRSGYIVAGSLGYYWSSSLHLEGEYAFRRNGISKIHFFGQGFSKHGHFQTSSYMANLLWDAPLASWGICWDIQPFIGAGIGYDSQKMHAKNSRIIFNQKWHHFSWQAMAGFAYPIYCNTDLTLEYKFHQGGCHFYNHSIGVGLVYKFGL